MKLKIKIRLLSEGCKPVVMDKGDWVDLRSSEDITVEAPIANTLNGGRTRRTVEFKSLLIPLGICMELPDGFEAEIRPRSSTFKNFGIIQANSVGTIDNSYCGNEDEWKMPVICLKDCNIKKFDRICQFRIKLSQKATIFQKIKWLFSSGVEFEEVDNLNSNSRGGFGSTNTK